MFYLLLEAHVLSIQQNVGYTRP